MKKLAVYPFTYECRELVQYKHLLDNYELAAVVTPDDSYTILNEICTDAGVKITSDFQEILSFCDTVLFLGTLYDRLETEYWENMRLTQAAGKAVLVDQRLKGANIPVLKPGYQLLPDVDLDVDSLHTEKLRRIRVPVISVLGIGKYCNKFRCEIMLRDYFRSQGIKVFHLASKEIGSLFGMDMYPSFMYDTSYTEFDRTLMLNHYVFNKIRFEQPDLVIIGVDEPIMPFNNKILNGFGHQAIMVGDALNVDCGILGIANMESLPQEFLQQYRNFCQFRLNTIIDCFLHSNTKYLLDDDDSGVINYYHLNSPPLADTVESGDIQIPVFSMEDASSAENAFRAVHNLLLENIDVF